MRVKCKLQRGFCARNRKKKKEKKKRKKERKKERTGEQKTFLRAFYIKAYRVKCHVERKKRNIDI